MQDPWEWLPAPDSYAGSAAPSIIGVGGQPSPIFTRAGRHPQGQRRLLCLSSSSFRVRVLFLRALLFAGDGVVLGRAFAGSGCCRHSRTCRSFVLATLRARHLEVRRWLSPPVFGAGSRGAVRTGMSHLGHALIRTGVAGAGRVEGDGLAAGRQIVLGTTPVRGVSRLSGQARRQDQKSVRAGAAGGRRPGRRTV